MPNPLTPVMFEPFFLRAWLAGLGIALIAGPLGCLVVWRRLAYFGDSLSHSALLGVAAGLVLGVSPKTGILFSCLLFAGVIVLLQRRQTLATDTALGITAYTGLSLGLVLLALMQAQPVDIHTYLFGDILSVAQTDVIAILATSVVALGMLALMWRTLLVATLHRDLARAEGLPLARTDLGLTVLLALVVASSIQIVGVLLVTALLVIPAATARAFARTPESMAGFAAGLGMLAVTAGLWASLHLDVPTGPVIVVAASSLFGCSLVLRRGR